MVPHRQDLHTRTLLQVPVRRTVAAPLVVGLEVVVLWGDSGHSTMTTVTVTTIHVSETGHGDVVGRLLYVETEMSEMTDETTAILTGEMTADLSNGSTILT